LSASLAAWPACATVTPVAGGGTALGSVEFTIDDVPVDGALPLVNGRASLTTSRLKLGHHTIEVSYRSSANPGFHDSGGRLIGGQDIGPAGSG